MEFFHDGGSIDMSVERPEILGRPKCIHGFSKVCPGLVASVIVGEITLESCQKTHANSTFFWGVDVLDRIGM